MKKVIIFILCALAALAVLLFAGEKLMEKVDEGEIEADTVSIVAESTKEIADAVVDSIGMTDFVSLNSEQIVNHFGFDTAYLSESTVYASNVQNNADEVAVFRFASEEAAQKAMPAISERVERKSKTFNMLNRDEYNKVEKTIFLNKGEYVILVITSKTNSAWNAIESFYQSAESSTK